MAGKLSNPPLDSLDDPVRLQTKITAILVIPFLIAAFIILVFLPGESGRRFAWEIQPNITAVWMGAGYLGGAYFFLRVALEKRWHRVAAGFWPVTAFTWGMLLATVLHWSRFDPGHLPFQIWLALYVVTPFWVPYLWWRNRSPHTPPREARDTAVPAAARTGMMLIGIFMLTSCLICYLAPNVAIAFWPWTLTPLTARIMGGWFALMGVGGLMMARQPYWSGWRYQVESIIFVWQVLVLIGAFVYREEFKPGTSWFFAAEIAVIAALLGLYITMQRRVQQAI